VAHTHSADVIRGGPVAPNDLNLGILFWKLGHHRFCHPVLRFMYRTQPLSDIYHHDDPISKMAARLLHFTSGRILRYDFKRFMYINGSACHEPRESLPFDLGDSFITLGFAGLGGRTLAIEDKLRLVGETSTDGPTHE
jgi:hypothetical protein